MNSLKINQFLNISKTYISQFLMSYFSVTRTHLETGTIRCDNVTVVTGAFSHDVFLFTINNKRLIFAEFNIQLVVTWLAYANKINFQSINQYNMLQLRKTMNIESLFPFTTRA